MYDLARFFGRSLVRSWYEREFGALRPLEQGPLLLVGNHRNGLVDPVWVWLGSERRVRFLAKYKLLSMPLLGWLVRRTEAIPVYRKKDNVDTARNLDSFEAVFARLAAGEAVVLFPEGESGDATHLRPFKTGAARMALGAEEAAGWTGAVRLQPFGILYEDRDRWRSRARVWFGEPFAVDDLRADHERDPWGTVQVLTDRVRTALEAVTVTVPEPGDEPLVLALEGCLPPDDAPMLQRLDACGRALVRDRERGGSLDEDARALAHLLAGTDLVPADLDGELPDATVRRGLPALLADALLLAPVQLLALVCWAPPVGLARLLARHGPSPPDKRVTVILLASVALGLPWVLLVLGLAASRAGLTGVLWAAVALAVSAFGAVPLVRLRRRVQGVARTWLRFGEDASAVERARALADRVRRRLVASLDALEVGP